MTTNNNGQKDYSAIEFWNWDKTDAQWGPFLAELRTKISILQRQVQTKQAKAKEVVTSLNRDTLAANLTTLEDLTNLEATATDTLVNILSDDQDMVEKAKAEETASKKFTETSDAIIKAATKTIKQVSDKIDEKNERENRRDRRRFSQESIHDGQHHSDPPKVFIANDLKPEQLSETVNQLELEDWIDRAECYAEASNITAQSHNVQYGYLQALVSPSMWIAFKEYCEAQLLIPADIDFEKGLDILKETYFKKNDMYTLKLQTSADTFKGKSYQELQSWFFKFRQKARNCGLSNMSEDEMLCFRLITAMSSTMQQTLFVQNPRPTLQETLDFVDNQVMVENMTNRQTKRKQEFVHNISEVEKPGDFKCWTCNGNHKRDSCTADKRSLKCDKCDMTGHVTEACRGRGRRPSSSRGRRRTTSPSSTSSSSSSSRERRRRRRKRKEDKRQRSRERKSEKSTRRRASSATSNSVSASRSRGRTSSRDTKHKTAGRTPKISRKKREPVNHILETVANISDCRVTMRASRMVQVNCGRMSSHTEILATLDTGSKYSLLDQEEVNTNNWRMEPISIWETPNLTNPDGRELKVIGKTTLWIRLAGEKHNRKVEFLVTPQLKSKLIVGLNDLKRLHWVSPKWPADIEKWAEVFKKTHSSEEADISDNEAVNNIEEEDNDDDEEEEAEDEEAEETKEEEEDKAKHNNKDEEKEEAKNDDKDEEVDSQGKIDITDFADLRTFEDIPGLKEFPNWLQEQVIEFQDIFTNQTTKTSIMNVEPVTLSLREDVKIPNKNITASLPPANLRASADKLLDKLERNNLISKASRVCKYKSKAFFKPKKNNDARLLIDYKHSQVNQLIERPVMPQMGVEQLLSQVKPGMKYFLSADLTGAYFCYPLAEGPQGSDLTCFLTHKGKFVFNVLPMGLAPSQDYLAETLTDLLDQEEFKEDDTKGTIRLVDDIAGFTKTEEQMKAMTNTLFRRCREFNIKLNPTKFQFSTEQIKFGGVIISSKGVTPDPERMNCIKNYPRPSSSRDVKSFLGCATSLASFTSVLLQDCKALRALTKKGVAFHWGDEEEQEFRQIVSRLTDPALLHHYDLSQPLAIDVDTSCKGVGYTAYMYDEAKGPPGPNNAKLVRCGSAAAKPSWSNYSPIELEATGTLLAVRKLDHYLINNKQVVVRNDHLPFCQAYNSRDISQVSPRLRRIFLELAELDIKLLWADAGSLVHVDALSRHPVDTAESMGSDPIDQQTRAMTDTVNNICEIDQLHTEEDNNLDPDNIDLQVNDPLYSSLFYQASICQGYQDAIAARMNINNDINWKDLPTGCYMKQLKDIWPDLHIVENRKKEKLFVYEGTKFLVPPGAIPDILQVVDLTHMGFPKAIGYAKAKYFWPRMSQMIEAHCNSCLICIQHSQAFPSEPTMPPSEDHIPSTPFEVISCDEFAFHNKNYLMIVDSFSSYSKAFHLPGRRTAEVLIKHIMQWQLDTGFARVIGTDGAKVWTGEEFQTFLKQNKIEHRLSAPMKAASNGRAEERIKSYKQMLTKLHYEGRTSEADARSTWELLQNMPSRPGQFSPARIAFRRERRHPLMPCIPADGGEAEKGKQQFQHKLDEQVKRNSRMPKNIKKPTKFVVGQRVLTQKYSSGNTKRDKSFSLPAKVIAIRPNTHEMSAVLEFPDGKTTIRDRIHCKLDPSQPQPDTVNNIEASTTEYFKLIPKAQEETKDDGQMIDSMMQKLKARGSEVEFMTDVGDFILVKIKNRINPHSCLKTDAIPKVKLKVRFSMQEYEEDS